MLVYMWLWNKNISVVGNKVKDVLFGSAHCQRACAGSVCLSIILWVSLENTQHTKWVLNHGFKTNCLGEKNQPNVRVAHQDRESPRSAWAAPLGELRLHPSFSSNHLEVEENDGFLPCFISFQHANSATSSSTWKPHLQRLWLVVFEERVGTGAGFGFTLALPLVGRENHLLSGWSKVGLKNPYKQRESHRITV